MTESGVVRAGVHEAKIAPIRPAGKRHLGIDEGVFVVPDDFDAPLPDDVLEGYSG